MKIQQLQYFDKAWKIYMYSDGFDRMQCQLVLAYGEPSLITETSVFNHLERSYPEACIILCSTERNTMQQDVFGNSVVVTAVEFDNTSILCAETSIHDHKNNFEVGKYLVQQLQPKEPATVFLLADGAGINGHDLADGFNAGRPGNSRSTARTDSQGVRFIKRMTGLNKLPGDGTVVAVVLKGDEHGFFQMEQYLRIVPTATANR